MSKLERGSRDGWHLLLADNSISDEGAEALADALKHNTTVQFLCLSRNPIGDDGARALASALKHNTTIWNFRFNDNKISDEAAQAFADALASNTTLEIVGLQGCTISARGKAVLNDARVKF